MQQQPVVILGMHRSGTTMITRLLEQLGLFVGAEKEVNHEALFFWEINNWIFDLHTATPEKPYNLRYTNPECRKVVEESLHYFVRSSRRKKYLGSLASSYASITELDQPFGWKDPKNTFTLDFWKSVFPNPRIIHIYRHPIDCVSSYIERDLALKNKFTWNWKKKLKREWLVSRHFHENFRLYDLQQGYALWEEYVQKALDLRITYPDYLNIRYESFLEKPEHYLTQMAAFCQLPADMAAIQTVSGQVKKDRAFAFQQVPAYRDFYEQIKQDPLLQELGYSDL